MKKEIQIIWAFALLAIFVFVVSLMIMRWSREQRVAAPIPENVSAPVVENPEAGKPDKYGTIIHDKSNDPCQKLFERSDPSLPLGCKNSYDCQSVTSDNLVCAGICYSNKCQNYSLLLKITENFVDWKVYTDNTYGFKFKYPSLFSMEDVVAYDPTLAKDTRFTGKFITGTDNKGGSMFDSNQFSVKIVKKKFNLDELANMSLWGSKLGKEAIKEETVNNVKIYSYNFSHSSSMRYAVVPRGDYEIEFSYTVDGGKNDYIRAYWNQIISSFQLTK